MSDQRTRLESEEDFDNVPERQILAVSRKAVSKQPAATADDAPIRFRPQLRPPVPLLIAIDDSGLHGETIRIRKDSFVIGRSEGDFTVPCDTQMSSRHAELRCVAGKDRYRWTLVDLGSTNGTFVRVSHAALDSGKQFLIGSTRLEFESTPSEDLPAPAETREMTRLWAADTTQDASATIVNLTTKRRVLLEDDEVLIGSDARHCQCLLPSDPFASGRHAKIRRDAGGTWVLENNRSLNGVWLRVDKIAIDESCRFQLGEQRFIFRLVNQRAD